MMDRRRFLLTSLAGVLAAPLVVHLGIVAGGFLPVPLAAEAQAGRTYRVAVLGPFSTSEGLPYRQAFFDGMRDLGYVEGRNVIFDVRTSDRDRAQVPALVDELVALKPDVLVSDGNAGQILRDRAGSIPIVLTASIDPVGQGLAQSLRRPGANVTGISLFLDQLAAKHIDIMREIRPQLTRVGLFFDTTSYGCNLVEDSARQATRSLGVDFVSYPVATRDEIARSFAQMQQQKRPDMLIPCPAALLFNNRDLLYENAVRLRIPFTSFVTANLPLGVLFSYRGVSPRGIEEPQRTWTRSSRARAPEICPSSNQPSSIWSSTSRPPRPSASRSPRRCWRGRIRL
jgi:putative tryptophan/tyrosine transport system substrate-binding protein